MHVSRVAEVAAFRASRALKRHGGFVILRETVLSSGRKLRTYSRAEFARLIAFLLRTGPCGLRDRQALDLWYGGRRVDPGED